VARSARADQSRRDIWHTDRLVMADRLVMEGDRGYHRLRAVQVAVSAVAEEAEAAAVEAVAEVEVVAGAAAVAVEEAAAEAG
jgi:chitinase